MALRQPEDLDVDHMAESELQRLQRQYRLMEADKQSYTEEKKLQIHKQRNLIKILEKEKEDILASLELCKPSKIEVKDMKSRMRLAELFDLVDKYEMEIKQERSQLSDLKFQVSKIEGEVLELRRKGINDRQRLALSQESQKNITNLENRLGVATIKFNKMLAENSALREEIDHLIKERTHYNQLHEQLTEQITTGKKIIVDLIEQANLAYDQREEAQNKLQALRDRGKVDLSIHGQEMRELQRQLDHNNKLQQFLGRKGQKRVMADFEEREKRRKESQKESQEQLIANYQDILERIKECSGETDIDRLAAQFVKQEEENFALFNYVNELNSELEILQEQTEELVISIKKQREENKVRSLIHKDTIDELQIKLKTSKEEAVNSQNELDKTNQILSTILKSVENIFQTIRSDDAPMLELLGEETHVTSYNIMLFLGIINQQIADLLALYQQKYK